MQATINAISPEAASVCDRETLADLEDLFGRERLLTMLAGFGREIDSRLPADLDDPARVAADAHALVSTSGALGFTTLSLSCVALERVCLNGGAFADTLAATRIAARDAKAAIGALCASS